MGLQFQYIHWVWLFLTIIVLFFLFLRHYYWRKKTVKALGNFNQIKILLNGFSHHRKLFLQIIIALIFLLGTLAAMDLRKAISGDGIIRKGVDAMIVLDVSNSMLATDIKPSRLLKAKSFIYDLINASPQERFGLILFAGDAVIQLPITSDHSTLDLFLDDAEPSYMPYQGSDIDSAIQRTIEAFDNQQNTYKSAILISDGEEHDGKALQFAKNAREKGIVINTVGVGTLNGATILDDSTGSDKKDVDGNIITTHLNDHTLKEIAATTNGQYILLNDNQKAVSSIKNIFSKIDERTGGDTTLMNFAHYYWAFIIPMIALLIIELFMPVFKKQK